MDRKHWRGLLLLNAALLAVLVLVSTIPSATAQDARARQRGDFAIIGARVQGIAESAIFIVDANNLEMVALRYDQSDKTLKPLGYRNIAADANQARGGRGGR